METFYTVTRNGKPCGKVSVRRQGLYYIFHCRCIVDDRDIYRLIVSCGDYRESLGILVPTDEYFGITARLPVKQLREGDWSFHITSRQDASAIHFVPISPEEPFAYITRLKDSFLIYQNGQPGIGTAKMQE